MKIIVNGKEEEHADTLTLQMLLSKLQLTEKPVIVELNKTVIPHTKYADQILREMDHIEIAHFVGGG